MYSNNSSRVTGDIGRVSLIIVGDDDGGGVKGVEGESEGLWWPRMTGAAGAVVLNGCWVPCCRSYCSHAIAARCFLVSLCSAALSNGLFPFRFRFLRSLYPFSKNLACTWRARYLFAMSLLGEGGGAHGVQTVTANIQYR